MGTKDCSWRTLLFLGGFLLMLGCLSFEAKAQVIINETMELKNSPKSQEKVGLVWWTDWNCRVLFFTWEALII